MGCKDDGKFRCVCGRREGGCGDDGRAIIAVEAQVMEPRIKVESCG